MFSQISKVLVLAPHPDDAEFGLGGTIKKLHEMKKDIHVAVFSMCEKSTPKGFEIGQIEKEMKESLDFLKIPSQNRHIYNYEVRTFPSERQSILEDLVGLRKDLNPDLIFLPSSSDIHQDHKTINEEGIRAFKHSCLLGYEMPWNNLGFTSYVFVKLDSDHIKTKLQALELYESQKMRNYSNIDFVTSLAKLRGIQIQAEFAESFEMIRFIQN